MIFIKKWSKTVAPFLFSFAHPPVVLAVDHTRVRPEDFKFAEGQEGNFTILGTKDKNGDVVLRSGVGATIEFFAYAKLPRIIK